MGRAVLIKAKSLHLKMIQNSKSREKTVFEGIMDKNLSPCISSETRKNHRENIMCAVMCTLFQKRRIDLYHSF